MHVASYARKSVYSDKSDSIKNQELMSKEYMNFNYPGQIESFTTYEDEDHSGSNANRPALQELIVAIKNKLVDALVVYQLDRLSRDVRDFSNIYALMEEYGVKFISVKEKIDTSTPIGKAMMYVTVVFAQMERENISNRVNDNMIGLAKRGFWTGGNPPIGYNRTKIEVGGKTHVTLEVVEEDAKYIHWLADLFLDNKFSIQGLETYLKNNCILTKNGKHFSSNALHKNLSMPTCVAGTTEIYDYFSAKGCIMETPREQWDGKNGLIIYGRTTERGKKHVLNPPSKWRVMLGIHEPFMDAEKWLRIQAQFGNNVINKKMIHNTTLLKGILRCDCGRLMSLTRKKIIDGTVNTWYACPKRMRQGSDYCNMKQIKAEVLDTKVLDIFKAIERDQSIINQYSKKTDSNADIDNSKAILSQINSVESKIEKLASSLAENATSSAAKYIVSEMERLDLTLVSLNKQKLNIEADKRIAALNKKTLEQKRLEIISLVENIDKLSIEEQNEIAISVIKECVWDGTELSVVI